MYRWFFSLTQKWKKLKKPLLDFANSKCGAPTLLGTKKTKEKKISKYKKTSTSGENQQEKEQDDVAKTSEEKNKDYLSSNANRKAKHLMMVIRYFLCTLVWFYLDFSRIFFFKERGININTHCVSISVRVKSNTVIDFIHVSFNDLLQLLFCWFAFLLVVIHSLFAYLCEKMLYDIKSTVVLLFSDIWHRWCICVLLLLSAIFVTDFYHHNL